MAAVSHMYTVHHGIVTDSVRSLISVHSGQPLPSLQWKISAELNRAQCSVLSVQCSSHQCSVLSAQCSVLRSSACKTTQLRKQRRFWRLSLPLHSLYAPRPSAPSAPTLTVMSAPALTVMSAPALTVMSAPALTVMSAPATLSAACVLEHVACPFTSTDAYVSRVCVHERECVRTCACTRECACVYVCAHARERERESGEF